MEFRKEVENALRERGSPGDMFLDECAKERPQQLFEVLLRLQGEHGGMGDVARVAWQEMSRLKPCSVSFEPLWQELTLQPTLARLFFVREALVHFFGGDVVVPSDVARLAKARGDTLGFALWLLSAEPDVPGAVAQVADKLPGEIRRLGDCLTVAVRRHQVNVTELVRRAVVIGGNSVKRCLQLAVAVGVELEDSEVFSEPEWSLLLADFTLVPTLLDLFPAHVQLRRLMETCIARCKSHEEDASSILWCIGKRMTREEVDELIVLFDSRFDDTPTIARNLAPLVRLSAGSLELRVAAMRRCLVEDKFVHDLLNPDLDWSAFSDTQLLELVAGERALLGSANLAREVCRRELEPPTLRAFINWTMMADAIMCEEALCRYALYKVALFDSAPLDASLEDADQSAAREIIFALCGWTQVLHPCLPREVQDVALVTLWALTKRVRTRHLVYWILERAIRPVRSFLPEFHTCRVQAVVRLLRRRSARHIKSKP